jgi:hypothetical protein
MTLFRLETQAVDVRRRMSAHDELPRVHGTGASATPANDAWPSGEAPAAAA